MVMQNEKNELIPTRTVIGWRVYTLIVSLTLLLRRFTFSFHLLIRCQKDWQDTHNYFFYAYSKYNQISVVPDDQEKATFTFPYRRMSFDLCNALTVFQRCMMAIFFDIVKKFIEAFMDDFLVFGSSFDECLEYLSLVLQLYKEINLILNGENAI